MSISFLEAIIYLVFYLINCFYKLFQLTEMIHVINISNYSEFIWKKYGFLPTHELFYHIIKI